MDNLPGEMIEYVLKNSNLNMRDVVNFSSTCSKFRDIVLSSTSIWKSKYFQRWPTNDIDFVFTDWRKECIARSNLEKKALQLLSKMSSDFYKCSLENISGSSLDFIYNLINDHKFGYYYVRDFLISVTLLPLSQSLTNKFYSNVLLKHINKNHCMQIWGNLLQLDSKEQTLEKGVIFVAEWFKNTGISRTVFSELNNIALRVKHYLLQQYKEHPIKNIPEEITSTWEKENIPNNIFEPHYCIPILAAINFSLFEDLKFSIIYNLKDLEWKYFGIEYAVADKRAIPLTFAVLYESVARRLGVKIEVLDFSDHLLLRWKEDYNLENSTYHYINMNNKGLFIKNQTCPRSRPSRMMAPCSMEEITQKASFIYSLYISRGENIFLEKSATELLIAIAPLNVEWYQNLYRYYVVNRVNAKDLISKLLTIKEQIDEISWRWFQPLLQSLLSYQISWEKDHAFVKELPVVRVRCENVEFAVGMIVRDKISDVSGVIFGWETDAVMLEESWSNQPIYRLLTISGNDQYVPQCHLQILHSPPFISHPFIGRYFEEFCTTYYKPNKELQAEYPEDLDALLKIIKKDREAMPAVGILSLK